LHDFAQQLLDFRLALNFTCAHNVLISKVSAVRIRMTLGSGEGVRTFACSVLCVDLPFPPGRGCRYAQYVKRSQFRRSMGSVGSEG
jgi:hypothetical protein